jgi:hypothetical protein
MIVKIVQLCNIASVHINKLYARVSIIVQIVEME